MKDVIKLFMSIFVGAAFAGIFFGCIELDNEDDDDTATTSTELEGTWNTGCVNRDETGDENDESSSDTFIYTSNSVAYSGIKYNGLNCAEEETRRAVNYTFTIGTVVSDSSPDVKKIDKTVLSFKMMLKLDTVVNRFNTDSVCGLTDWTKDSEKDITGLTCVIGNNTISTSGISYDIYKLDTISSPNRLYVGDENTGDGSTDASRPTALETTYSTR